MLSSINDKKIILDRKEVLLKTICSDVHDSILILLPLLRKSISKFVIKLGIAELLFLSLTLLYLERPKLHTILAFLGAIGLSISLGETNALFILFQFVRPVLWVTSA